MATAVVHDTKSQGIEPLTEAEGLEGSPNPLQEGSRIASAESLRG